MFLEITFSLSANMCVNVNEKKKKKQTNKLVIILKQK